MENTNTKILINLKEALNVAPGGYTDAMERYNGGWCKTITALDKTKDNGYSLVGEFVHKVTSIAYQPVGLFLDCDISGSRKNQRKYYTLFSLDAAGSATVLATAEESRDWAVKMWPAIEKWFGESQEIDARIAAIDAEIQATETRLAQLRADRETLAAK